MGQRLNIEIVDNDKTLANAYYHWSAYTDSAVALTERIIEVFEETNTIGSLALAVELLQATGAGLNDSERKRINEDLFLSYEGINFQDCKDRNTGLLAVTEEGIEETRRWEEGRVTINIDTETVDFSVYWIMDEDECEENEWDMSSFKECDFDFGSIPFSEFFDFANLVKENDRGIKDPDGYIYAWIA